MTYSEAVDYILDIPKFTKKNDAAHTKAFLKTLGDPQRKMRIIHVAGTNGKGSVCAYLDGMLRSEQKRTGLFTSPHLVKINERIVIDGQMISDERFLEVFEETMQAVDKMKEAGLSHPTFFEFLSVWRCLHLQKAAWNMPFLRQDWGEGLTRRTPWNLRRHQ